MTNDCFESYHITIGEGNIAVRIMRMILFKRDVINSFLGQKIEQKYNVPHGCISSYLI
jgi:hypothetical protein